MFRAFTFLFALATAGLGLQVTTALATPSADPVSAMIGKVVR